jgi:hypothetical protein
LMKAIAGILYFLFTGTRFKELVWMSHQRLLLICFANCTEFQSGSP